MEMIEEVKGEVERIAKNLRKETLAVGLFGSLARGEFNEKSDIDIFVITSKELTLKEQDEFYYAFSELIPRFGRDVTVLVYDIESLKKIPSWQTFNLIRDAIFVHDVSGIEKIFKDILRKAEQHGIVYDEKERVFKLKKKGRIVFSYG